MIICLCSKTYGPVTDVQKNRPGDWGSLTDDGEIHWLICVFVNGNNALRDWSLSRWWLADVQKHVCSLCVCVSLAIAFLFYLHHIWAVDDVLVLCCATVSSEWVIYGPVQKMEKHNFKSDPSRGTTWLTAFRVNSVGFIFVVLFQTHRHFPTSGPLVERVSSSLLPQFNMLIIILLCSLHTKEDPQLHLDTMKVSQV